MEGLLGGTAFCYDWLILGRSFQIFYLGVERVLLMVMDFFLDYVKFDTKVATSPDIAALLLGLRRAL